MTRHVFRQASGLMVHDHSILHRHGDDGDPEGGHGECEAVKNDQHSVPDAVRSIVAEMSDAPVATRSAGEE